LGKKEEMKYGKYIITKTKLYLKSPSYRRDAADMAGGNEIEVN
jgi:hypothetical protein